MRQFILVGFTFLIFSCNSKQGEQSIKNESKISISLLTDYFHFTPHFSNDILGTMKNKGVNELIYNLKNETEKEQVVFLNHLIF